MLIIKQGQVNPLVTTLTEKKQSATTIYLIQLFNETTKTNYYCVAQDLSTSPNRYNKFCVTEVSGGTNPYNAEVTLSLAGFYYYNIYENPNSVLLPAGLNKVEQGKCLVLADKFEKDPVYQPSAVPPVIAFNAESYL